MQKMRVLIAKLGLDGHDLGAKWVARGLRDAGMEVIYTGRQKTPEQVASTALQEDADVVGLSFLSGAHLGLTERLIICLRALGIEDKKVVVGGVIPKEDISQLKEMGVIEVFPIGSQINKIVETLAESWNR
ncbi:MAG: cobalamin B12-binding domain-containing protein [Thermodesulfobacteriota bacterium]